jgi:hypothetical protein
MKKTVILFQLLNLLFTISVFAVELPRDKEFIIKECYDKLANKKIKIVVFMKFGNSGDWSTESTSLKVWLIESDGKLKAGKEIGQVDLYAVSIPLQMWRVRLNNSTEIAYLIRVTGHRSREIVVKITPEGATNIFEEVGFDLLKEEVLDVDGDGVDEIILYRGNPKEGKKTIKEIYKYQKGTFEKISQSTDLIYEWFPSCR